MGEGPRRGDRHQPSARRRRARAAALGRPRPAARRRRQPRQHPLRRRAALDADDEHGAAAAGGRSAATTRPTSPVPTRSPAPSSSRSPTSPASAARRARQVRDDVRPRIARSRSYALIRAWATVVQRDLQVATVVGDVLAGRPVIYTTFLAYDEVAHHSGIERHDALAVLRDLDRQIARIADGLRRRRRGPTGWSSSPTTASRRARPSATATGRPSRSWSARPATPSSVIAVEGGDDDALSYLSAGLTEVARDDTVAGAHGPHRDPRAARRRRRGARRRRPRRRSTRRTATRCPSSR